jgi:ABC-2 type transport system permease protein
MKKELYTVWVFTRLNTRRFFRDRLALFFGIMFPLIFLFVFGGISGKSANSVSFKVALLNESNSAFAKQFVQETKNNKVFKVDETITTLSAANDKMNKSQLDGTIVLPPDFGKVVNGTPTGQAKILYTSNNEQAGQTLTAVMQTEFKGINSKFVPAAEPFTVTGVRTKNKALTSFDYTFAGLLGFSILGIGIFGPINVFPELKKQGILRRFHTTPIKVWQYFVSTVFTQIATGLVGLAVMFLAALTVFHLKVLGNYFEIALFLIFGITVILGIGLAIGGWAKNERQAAPLSNIIVFPMMFLSGTFFPRYLMPHWLQGVSSYLPLTPIIDGVRFMTTEGKHIIDLGPQLGIMAVWLVVIYAIAFRVFRWE